MKEQLIKRCVILLTLVLLLSVSVSNYFHPWSWDVTQNHANSLTTASKQLLDHIEDPLIINIYSPNIDILNLTNELLKPYAQHCKKLTIKLHENTLDPRQAAELKLYTEHNFISEYNGVRKGFDINTIEISERKISTLIQETINQTQQWLVFLSGHKELDPLDNSEMGISNFAQLFKNQGMQIAKLNLAEQQHIPSNTNVLIVANPQQDFLPLEKELLKQYIDRGGNILWFTEPYSPVTALLTENFGLKLARGIAVDPDSLKLGSPHSALKIMSNLPNNVITKNVNGAIILPWSGHLESKYAVGDWQPNVILSTPNNTWLYNGPETMELNILAKHKEQLGPLNIAFALHRNVAESQTEQHALLVADSSFILNKYINLYSNAHLLTNMLDWVQNDINYFVFSPHTLKDLSYNPSKYDVWIYKYFFTIFLPLLFVSMGFYLQRS